MATPRAAVSSLFTRIGGARRLRSRQTAVRICIALCSAVLIGLVFSYLSLLAGGRLSIAQSDFLAYDAAARLLATGHGNRIYDFHAIAHAQAPLIAPVKLADGGLPYLYPPFFALVLVSLAALPLGTAFGVWLVVNCVLLAVTLRALQRYARLSRRGSALLWVGSLSFLPVFMAVTQGQVSVLLLASLSACLLALRAGHDRVAGVALALALLKPTYMLPFLLLLVLRRRWQALAAFSVAATCLLALPIPIAGFGVNASYLHILSQATSWHGHFGFDVQRNQTLAGLSQLLAPGPGSRLLTGVLDLLALALLVRVALRSREIDLPLGLAVVVAVLINPHVFIHDLTMLVLPAAAAARCRESAGRQMVAVLTFGYVAALVAPWLMAGGHLQICVPAMVALAVSLTVTAQRLDALAGGSFFTVPSLSLPRREPPTETRTRSTS